MGYKPDGYNDVSPYLIVEDIAATMDFLKAAFGAEPIRVMHRPDGTPMHGEARIGDSIVMMGQQTPSGAAHVHVYVADVRATYDAALAAGASSVQSPLDQGDGDLRAGVRDHQGTCWWPSTQMKKDP